MRLLTFKERAVQSSARAFRNGNTSIDDGLHNIDADAVDSQHNELKVCTLTVVLF